MLHIHAQPQLWSEEGYYQELEHLFGLIIVPEFFFFPFVISPGIPNSYL